MIDAKDLRLIQSISEIKPGAVFYLKNEDGTFSHCVIDNDEIKDAMRKEILRYETEKFIKLKVLFTRINRPWKSFNEKVL